MTEKEKSVKSKKNVKKEVLPELSDNLLLIAGEVIKNITPLTFEVNQHFNRKTLIINETDFNPVLAINVKLAQIKDIKSAKMKFLDNDFIEVNLDFEHFSSKEHIELKFKIENGEINSNNAEYLFANDDYPIPKQEIMEKVFSILNKNIMQHLFLPNLIKQFSNDLIQTEKNIIKINLKEGNLKSFYEKTLNQIFNTNLPYFGQKHITDIFQIESIMCEKEQLWIDVLFKIS